MPYLIDGHNLIPKLGIRLDSAEDELELAAVLQEFTRRQRRDAEVYFDGAPPGGRRERRFGRVTAHFVPAGSTADAAIKARVRGLAGAARNWIVVSSDREVQNAARAARTRSVSSEEFARTIRRELSRAGRGKSRQGSRGDSGLSSEEVDEWMRVFRGED